MDTPMLTPPSRTTQQAANVISIDAASAGPASRSTASTCGQRPVDIFEQSEPLYNAGLSAQSRPLRGIVPRKARRAHRAHDAELARGVGWKWATCTVGLATLSIAAAVSYMTRFSLKGDEDALQAGLVFGLIGVSQAFEAERRVHVLASNAGGRAPSGFSHVYATSTSVLALGVGLMTVGDACESRTAAWGGLALVAAGSLGSFVQINRLRYPLSRRPL
jgi:hypothetical protein